MCIAGAQAKAMLEQDSRVHARQDRGMAAGAHGEITQVETAREDFVSG